MNPFSAVSVVKSSVALTEDTGIREYCTDENF